MTKIELTSIPGLETAQGVFGAISSSTTTYDDRIVAIIVFVHDTQPPIV